MQEGTPSVGVPEGIPDDPPIGFDATKALQRQLGLPKIQPMLVLHRNRDPFFAGTATHRQWAEWFAEVRRRFGERGHLRRVHYRLLGSGTLHPRGDELYMNTARHWQDLATASRLARVLGLVDPEQLEDKRNAAAQVHAWSRLEDPAPGWAWRYGDPEVPAWALPTSTDWLYLPSMGGSLPSVIDRGEDWPGLVRLPRAFVDAAGYDYRPTDESAVLEVWVEKSTVNDVLEPLCSGLGVNLVAGLGFESYTRVIELLRRAEAHHAGRAHVLYVSDRDRSGDRMPRTVGRQAAYFARLLGIDVQLSIERVALTRDQVRDYELPEDPTEGGRVELDALQALRPGELRRLIDRAVERWRDPDLPGRLADAATEARADVERQWAEDLEHVDAERETLEADARQVQDAYRLLVGAVRADMARILEPFHLPLAELLARIRGAVAQHQQVLGQAGEAKAEALAPLEERLAELADEAREGMEGFDP